MLKNNCPVPFDQQPLNEYLALKQSLFFHWSTYQINKYIYTGSIIFILLLILLGIILVSVCSNIITLWEIFYLDNLIIDIIFSMIFIRLYLGWSYVIKRLLSASIFYEESGWYDGQIWIKKSDNLIRDRLVGLYQVLPILNKIKFSVLFITLHLICNCLLYFFI